MDILPEDIRMVGIFSYLSGLLFISSFIAGYIAGNPKFGLKSGIIFFIVFLILVIVLYSMLTGYLIFIFPFAVILCVASGYYGGLTRDRRKLYPLVR